MSVYDLSAIERRTVAEGEEERAIPEVPALLRGDEQPVDLVLGEVLRERGGALRGPEGPRRVGAQAERVFRALWNRSASQGIKKAASQFALRRVPPTWPRNASVSPVAWT